MTGFSHTKINRCVAEGRERFRSLVSRSEDGRRCEELEPAALGLLRRRGERRGGRRRCASTCGPARTAARRCAPTGPRRGPRRRWRRPCRVSRSLLERAHEAFASLHSRLPWQGGAGDSVVSQVAAAGGTRGAGMAALAKVLAICAGSAGGAAACVAAGVVAGPLPLDLGGDHVKRPTIERQLDRPAGGVGLRAHDERHGERRRRLCPSRRRRSRRPTRSPTSRLGPLALPPPRSSSSPEASVPATSSRAGDRGGADLLRRGRVGRALRAAPAPGSSARER